MSGTDSDRKAERDDIEAMQSLLQQMDDLEAKKRKLQARIAARYGTTSIPPASQTDKDGWPKPPLEDDEQKFAYEYLKSVRQSVMKPMTSYLRGKGCDLGDTAKPGSRVQLKLKKRPDVFKYEAEKELWSLV
ncbi:MAG: hypothetical protein P4L85_14275 [Paludisphaera borealis]|uniref:hypothetical protein n=1 Tax=Paludisphaera borealis TaxID=1387353 RepID=UPI0028407EEA|nr:hypothetical protein [Paludisphaera borealis]MDR3620513.1 hypothetical protein [Paludisphaera borealis]